MVHSSFTEVHLNKGMNSCTVRPIKSEDPVPDNDQRGLSELQKLLKKSGNSKERFLLVDTLIGWKQYAKAQRFNFF